MTVTPYAHGEAKQENHCIYRFTYGITWDVPVGGVNPIAGQPTALDTFNFDPNMDLVGGKRYVYNREYSVGATEHETIWLTISTNGVTGASPQTAIYIGYIGDGDDLDHVQLTSPAIAHDGSLFIMLSRKNYITLERRTSANGATWSSPSATTLSGGTASKYAHQDVINAGDGKLFALIQGYGSSGQKLMALDSGTAESPNNDKMWLARSTNWGMSWAASPYPLLTSTGLATRGIYRTTGLWKSLNSKDYLLICYSGIDQDNEGREVWHVGYTEGYAPDAAMPATGLAIPGNAKISGDVSSTQAGFRRITARLAVFTRAVTSSLSAT